MQILSEKMNPRLKKKLGRTEVFYDKTIIPNTVFGGEKHKNHYLAKCGVFKNEDIQQNKEASEMKTGNS